MTGVGGKEGEESLSQRERKTGGGSM